MGHSILHPHTPTSTPLTKFSKGAAKVISDGFALLASSDLLNIFEGVWKKSGFFLRGVKTNLPISERGNTSAHGGGYKMEWSNTYHWSIQKNFVHSQIICLQSEQIFLFLKGATCQHMVGDTKWNGPIPTIGQFKKLFVWQIICLQSKSQMHEHLNYLCNTIVSQGETGQMLK